MKQFTFFKEEQSDELPNSNNSPNVRYWPLIGNDLTNSSRIMCLDVPRDNFGEQEFYDLLRLEREKFMEDLWRNNLIQQQIIYQDEVGFSLRTEFR